MPEISLLILWQNGLVPSMMRAFFYQSAIYDYMKDNVREYYLVGDNGYHISRLIIVPYYQPQAGSPELA